MEIVLLLFNIGLALLLPVMFILGWRSGFKYADSPKEAVKKKIANLPKKKLKPTKEQEHLQKVADAIESFEVK